LQALAPAAGLCRGRNCWKKRGDTFTYSDRDRSPNGLHRVQLRPGSGGETNITVQGKGENLALPGLPLSVSPEIIVQVLNSEPDGPCWAIRFGTNDVVQSIGATSSLRARR
jgi:hypothetical protein